jgi:DNA-binding transcriptional ArsR family regulator
VRDNRGVQSSTFASVRALAQLLDDLGAGAARRRQLDMVRGELERALERGALPVGARRSLRRLLEEEALGPYVRLAESGALRHRRVEGGFPPTSESTNEIRRKCVDLLREALGMPALRLGGGEIPLQPAPEAATISALRRQLDRFLGGPMSPAQTRLTAVLAVELVTRARSGELVVQRTTDLAPNLAAVYVERRPQGGGLPEGEWVETDELAKGALERWLPVRDGLVQRSHGTSRLWVSLWMNHAGVLDDQGNATIRPPGMPLEENGLITSYRVGRLRYEGLRQLLPLKLEALRRALDAEHERTAA